MHESHPHNLNIQPKIPTHPTQHLGISTESRPASCLRKRQKWAAMAAGGDLRKCYAPGPLAPRAEWGTPDDNDYHHGGGGKPCGGDGRGSGGNGDDGGAAALCFDRPESNGGCLQLRGFPVVVNFFTFDFFFGWALGIDLVAVVSILHFIIRFFNSIFLYKDELDMKSNFESVLQFRLTWNFAYTQKLSNFIISMEHR